MVSPTVNGRSTAARRGPTVGDARPARSLHTSTVVTPEAVLLEFRTAGLGSRVMAKGIDLAFQVMLVGVLFVPIGFVGLFSSTLAIVLGTVIGFVVIFGYPVIEAFRSGQTIGKSMLEIRVVTTEGGPVQFRHAAIRSLLWVVEFFLVPGGFVAMVSALVTRRSQRLGDMAAGTIVVRMERSLPQPVFFPPVLGAEAFSAQFDAGAMTMEQFAVLRDSMVRYRHLDADAAAHLVRMLSEGLERSGATPRPPDMPHEHHVMAAVFAYQRRFTFANGSAQAPILPSLGRRYGEGYSIAAPPPPTVHGVASVPGSASDWWPHGPVPTAPPGPPLLPPEALSGPRPPPPPPPPPPPSHR